MSKFNLGSASREELEAKRNETITAYKGATQRACHIYDYWMRYKKAEDFEENSIQDSLNYLCADSRQAIKEIAAYIKYLRVFMEKIEKRLMDMANGEKK